MAPRRQSLASRVFASPDLRQRLVQSRLLIFNLSDLGMRFERADAEQDIEQLQ
jgi:hypothetical protein